MLQPWPMPGRDCWGYGAEDLAGVSRNTYRRSGRVSINTHYQGLPHLDKKGGRLDSSWSRGIFPPQAQGGSRAAAATPEAATAATAAKAATGRQQHQLTIRSVIRPSLHCCLKLSTPTGLIPCAAKALSIFEPTAGHPATTPAATPGRHYQHQRQQHSGHQHQGGTRAATAATPTKTAGLIPCRAMDFSNLPTGLKMPTPGRHQGTMAPAPAATPGRHCQHPTPGPTPGPGRGRQRSASAEL